MKKIAIICMKIMLVFLYMAVGALEKSYSKEISQVEYADWVVTVYGKSHAYSIKCILIVEGGEVNPAEFRTKVSDDIPLKIIRSISDLVFLKSDENDYYREYLKRLNEYFDQEINSEFFTVKLIKTRLEIGLIESNLSSKRKIMIIKYSNRMNPGFEIKRLNFYN